jgi:hypothetical protein
MLMLFVETRKAATRAAVTLATLVQGRPAETLTSAMRTPMVATRALVAPTTMAPLRALATRDIFQLWMVHVSTLMSVLTRVLTFVLTSRHAKILLDRSDAHVTTGIWAMVSCATTPMSALTSTQ